MRLETDLRTRSLCSRGVASQPERLGRQDVLMSSSGHSPSIPRRVLSGRVARLLAAAALAAVGLFAALAAGAQQTGQMRRIGVLMGLVESDPLALFFEGGML